MSEAKVDPLRPGRGSTATRPKLRVRAKTARDAPSDLGALAMRKATEACIDGLRPLLPGQREHVIAAVAVLFGIDLNVERTIS